MPVQPPSPLTLAKGVLRRDGLVLRPGRLAAAEALASAIEDPEVHRWMDTVQTGG